MQNSNTFLLEASSAKAWVNTVQLRFLGRGEKQEGGFALGLRDPWLCLEVTWAGWVS